MTVTTHQTDREQLLLRAGHVINRTAALWRIN